MCNVATQDLVREVVQRKVNNDELFTAYDVSKEVQELAKQRGVPAERHRDMKNAIHDEMEQFTNSGVYARTSVDVGAPIPPFLYYPSNGDPNSYVPANPGHPIPVSAIPPTNPVAAAVSANPAGNGGRLADQRGTLTIPATLMRSMGFTPFQTAYVYGRTDASGNPVVAIAPTAPQGVSVLTTYTVDKACNVRVTQKQLRAAGIAQNTQDSFDFGTDNGEVYVRAH